MAASWRRINCVAKSSRERRSKWPLGESNPDALRHKILSLACLPISPSGQTRVPSLMNTWRRVKPCRRDTTACDCYRGVGFRHWALGSSTVSPILPDAGGAVDAPALEGADAGATEEDSVPGYPLPSSA
jgi:hypothetical protein